MVVKPYSEDEVPSEKDVDVSVVRRLLRPVQRSMVLAELDWFHAKEARVATAAHSASFENEARWPLTWLRQASSAFAQFFELQAVASEVPK